MADFLISFLVLALFVITLLGLFAISLGWRAQARDESGEVILRCSLPLRILAVVGGFIFPDVVLVLLILFPPNAPNMLASEMGLLAFKALGWLNLQLVFKYRVVITDNGLLQFYPWHRPISIPWDEITQVRSECPKSWFVFVAADGRRIDVPLYFEGLAQLVAATQLRLAPSIYALARTGFRRATKNSQV